MYYDSLICQWCIVYTVRAMNSLERPNHFSQASEGPESYTGIALYFAFFMVIYFISVHITVTFLPHATCCSIDSHPPSALLQLSFQLHFMHE